MNHPKIIQYKKIIKKFFRRKKIVYTLKFAPAEMIGSFTHKGKKYVRIAFTNRQKYCGYNPTTDIAIDEVHKIIRLPSEFEKRIVSVFFKVPGITIFQNKK